MIGAFLLLYIGIAICFIGWHIATTEIPSYERESIRKKLIAAKVLSKWYNNKLGRHYD